MQFSAVQFYTALPCNALNCTALNTTALNTTALNIIALNITALNCTALHSYYSHHHHLQNFIYFISNLNLQKIGNLYIHEYFIRYGLCFRMLLFVYLIGKIEQCTMRKCTSFINLIYSLFDTI